MIDNFDEKIYLAANPDVNEQVSAGIFSSGWEHFKLRGKDENRVSSIQGFLEQQNGQMHHLKHTIQQQNEDILELNNIIEKKKEVIYGLYTSRSWKITRPIRLTSRLFGRKGEEFKLQDNDIPDPGRKTKVLSVIDLVQKLVVNLNELPHDFDGDVYLQLYPDLSSAGINPGVHYLRYGRDEGRQFKIPTIDKNSYVFNADFETILVVSHEASRTGAPILSLNIVQELIGRYNIVVVLLGGGMMLEAFRDTGAAIMVINQHIEPIGFIVKQMCEQFNFKFALVNSIESRVLLPILGEHFVPTVTLVHEFASYTRPKTAFRDAFFWSGEIIFSTNVVKECAYTECSDLGDRTTHVLPQGRCLLPLTDFNEELHQQELMTLQNLIRPEGLAEDTLIVLGAGFVQLRKGVDLFIECAARVLREPGGRKCRFIWIGKGYDSENDSQYSVYLLDQIRRSGLQEHVFFIDETTAIEAAYEQADVFLVTSRLDPLPNVAIDAMIHGTPVLCFNRTTGIADFLIENNLKEHCVAGYLNTHEMADKILAFVNSASLRKEVGEQCRVASLASFNMRDYITKLVGLADHASVNAQKEQSDTALIVGSDQFRRDFSCPPHVEQKSIEREVIAYVRTWVFGSGCRKPFPGFHPGIYLEQQGLVAANTDPFADYLRSGCPAGPWNYPVIVATNVTQKELPKNKRVALHIHVYYPDLLPEIITRLSANEIHPDLFISIATESARKIVIKKLKHYQGKVVDIQQVPNRGRDIGPLLTAFGQRIVAHYDYVGHLHTKKTVDVEDVTVGENWYRFLLENLLGSDASTMADCILSTMESDSSIGMVFPDDPNIVGWSTNKAIAERLAKRMGLGSMPEHFIFPVGTMFWARTAVLVPFLNLRLDWDDYPAEPLPYDGTLLHALERLFPLSLSLTNLRCATTNVPGCTR
jgi:glycosyltransferase involved in cell wall biosynthesis